MYALRVQMECAEHNEQMHQIVRVQKQIEGACERKKIVSLQKFGFQSLDFKIWIQKFRSLEENATDSVELSNRTWVKGLRHVPG